MLVERSTDPRRSRRVAEEVLRALPEWFGMEEPLVGFVDDAATLPTYIATSEGREIGFLTLKSHTAVAGEITAMGVLPAHHRQGAGRALVEAAAQDLQRAGGRLLQVKTLGPSDPDEGYARTRDFYAACGFLPLEETTAWWGEANPCLVMVRVLRSPGLVESRDVPT